MAEEMLEAQFLTTGADFSFMVQVAAGAPRGREIIDRVLREALVPGPDRSQRHSFGARGAALHATHVSVVAIGDSGIDGAVTAAMCD